MKLTSEEKNDILLWWSGELKPDRQDKFRLWLESCPEARQYLDELKSLESLTSGDSESFQPIDIGLLFSDNRVDEPEKNVGQPNRSTGQRPSFGSKSNRGRRWQSMLLPGLALAIMVVGIGFFVNFQNRNPQTVPSVTLKANTKKVRSLRNKRKRLQWLQSQTRKNRQINFRHRSTTKIRWSQLRKRKPRKGLV